MKKNIVFFILVSIFLIGVFSVQAEGVALYSPLPSGSFDDIIKNVINTLLGLTGVLALLAFIFGGITWMISGGDPGKVTKGKNTMIWAIIGLLVIFSSYAILNVVFEALYGNSTEPGVTDVSSGEPL